MSKAIRWQIHFHEAKPDSQNPKHYRVDIYDEQDGSWSGITQLTAGDNPFTTTEDNSDDFFCPVRSQTGTLQICTALPGGGTITLNDLLPANNIARPVRVSSIAANNAETIEWQGFLSCEAYSQDYTSVPENIDIPVISVLEAMKSMFIDKDTFKPLGTIGCLLARTMNAISYGRYSNLYVPIKSCDILNKQINISSLFSKEEQEIRDQVVYSLKGVALYDVIELICNYMGWTAREQGRELFFQLPQSNGDMYLLDVSTIIQDDDTDEEWFLDEEATTVSMATYFEGKWKGTGHKRNFLQGAHSVSVIAKLEQFDVDTQIPDLPYGSILDSVYHQIGQFYVFLLASTDDNAYSNMMFGHYKANIQISDTAVTCGAYSASDAGLTVENSIAYARTQSPAYETYHDYLDSYTNYAGAFLARMQFDPSNEQDLQHQNTEDGLYISLFGGVWQEHTEYTHPIFQMKSVQVFAAYEDGYINIAAQVKAFWNDVFIGDPDSQTKLMIDLRIGDKVWTGSQWVSYDQHVEHFFIGFEDDKFESNWSDSMGIDEVDGLCIPVNKDIKGEITLSIYPETKKRTESSNLWRRMVYGMFFSQLNVSFIPKKDIKRTDRSNNTYYKELAGAFRDDIKKSVNLASWLHNLPSPSLLFNPNGTLMETLAYIEGEDTVNRVPEVDLLNRLAAYYGAARQRLELGGAHPTAAPLPLLKLNGINDGKVYLPLAESRDWRNDICQLTCFELPQ